MKSVGILKKREGGTYYYEHSFKCLKCRKQIKSQNPNKTVKRTGVCKQCTTSLIKSKPVSFKFYLTNQSVRAKSITSFCKRIFPNYENAKFHFAEVLNGKRLHYKGWFLSSNKVKLDLSEVKKIEQLQIKRAVIH